MNKTLHLPLKKEWYEMIESGIKTEEYKEWWDNNYHCLGVTGL